MITISTTATKSGINGPLPLRKLAKFCSTNARGHTRVKESTVGVYKNTQRRLVEYFGKDRDVKSITRDELVMWERWLEEADRVNATNNSYKRTCKAMFNVCREQGVMVVDPEGVFKMKKEPRGVQSTPEEVYYLMFAYSGIRTALLMAWAWDSGPRISDLAAMRVSRTTCQLTNGQYRVLAKVGRDTKGNKERTIPGKHKVGCLLINWLEARAAVMKVGGQDHDYLFVSLSPKNLGVRLSPNAITSVFARAREAAGIPKNVPASPHKFRHAAVKRHLKEGMPLSMVGTLVGHESHDTTLRYAIYGVEETMDAFFDDSEDE